MNKILLVILLALLGNSAHAGGVINGQPVNAAVTNAAFLFKNGPDQDPSQLDLVCVQPTSGASIIDIQRNLNSLNTFLGSTANVAYTTLPTWATSNRGTSSDSVFVRVEAIDTAFNSTTGHKHSGAAGDAPQIPFANLSGSISAGQIPNSTITNAMLTTVPAHTYKGNNTGSPATPTDVTSTQLTADLNVFTSSLQGLVPASGGSSTNTFLNQAGTFTTPTATAPTFTTNTYTSGTTLAAGSVNAGDASSASFTLTLPDATTNAGIPIYVVRKDSTPAFQVTILCAGADTFNGGNTTYVLNEQNDALTLISIGAIWYVF